MIGSIRRLSVAFIPAVLFAAATAHAGLTDGGVHAPANYYGFQPPARGGTYVDAVFGSTIKRLSNAPATPDEANGGMLQYILNEYSTPALWNTPNTYLLLNHGSYFAVYDGNGTYVKTAPFDMHAGTEPRWSRTDPNVVYYKRGNALKSYNVATNAIATVRAFTEYGAISGRGESDMCFDGDHVVLVGDNRDVFVYTISTNQKGAVLNTAGNGFDSVYIAADDTVTITWLANGAGRFRGIELFDQNMSFRRQVAQAGGHMDMGRDTNGDAVLIWTNSNDPAAICNNGIVKIRLATGGQTCLLELDWSLAVHISGNDQGWAIVSTYAPGDPNPGGFWPPYTNEVFRVRLDGSVVERLAHHRSRPFNSYNYMAKASISRDGSRITYSSNYGLGGFSEYGDVYLMNLGGGGGSPTPTPAPTSTPGPTPTPRPTVTKLEQDHASVLLAGAWTTQQKTVHSASSAAYTGTTGAEVNLAFTGTGITWRGSRDPWAGKAEVYVDGTLRATVDTYSPIEVNQDVLYTTSGLAGGAHTLKVKVLGTMNASSGAPLVWADSFEITGGSAGSPTPGAATLLSPSGTITTNRPTFTWNAVASATDYQLWVGDSQTALVNSSHPAASVCSGATCSVTPSVTLPNGGRSWWIQARNAAGAGPWSSAMSFVVSGGATATATPTPTPAPGGVPSQPTLVSPGGVTSTTPTYTWNAVANATDYQIWVGDASTAVINTWHTASGVCSGTTCSLTPGTSLAPRGYTWWILARNSAGNGPWSGGMGFTATTASATPTPTPAPGGAPGKPVLVSPNGTVTVTQPTFTWNAVANATQYEIWVGDASTAVINTTHAASAVCAGTTCSLTPTTALANRAYSWWVQARGTAGTGPWSNGMGFTVNAAPPAAAVLVSPSGTASRTPTYTWNAVSGATDYQLWVGGASVPIIQIWYSASAVCSGATCSVTPSTMLPAGVQSWWVQTRNSSGNGPWSAARTFAAQ
jgi:hypothetical protein